jgi:hypothetical protein
MPQEVRVGCRTVAIMVSAPRFAPCVICKPSIDIVYLLLHLSSHLRCCSTRSLAPSSFADLVSLQMNRCFGIRELVELFCSPLTRSQDLISFARACKSFLEPGLDNLWKEQSTLANLLLCMPSDLFNVLDDLPQPGSTSKNTYKQMVSKIYNAGSINSSLF